MRFQQLIDDWQGDHGEGHLYVNPYRQVAETIVGAKNIENCFGHPRVKSDACCAWNRRLRIDALYDLY
jgi:hypothetical protein